MAMLQVLYCSSLFLGRLPKACTHIGHPTRQHSGFSQCIHPLLTDQITDQHNYKEIILENVTLLLRMCKLSEA